MPVSFNWLLFTGRVKDGGAGEEAGPRRQEHLCFVTDPP